MSLSPSLGVYDGVCRSVHSLIKESLRVETPWSDTDNLTEILLKLSGIIG